VFIISVILYIRVILLDAVFADFN